jgi:hypothetical protein
MTMSVKSMKNSTNDVQEQYVRNTQAMAKRLAAAQARNVKYTQNLFESTIALLKSNMEDTHSLMEQWGPQEASQSSASSMNLFSAPFAAYQQMLEGVETSSRQMFEGVENLTKQSFERFQQATESFEEAGHSK